MSQILELPIEKFSWDKNNTTLSISRKDLNMRSAELLPIRVVGKIATVDFIYDYSMGAYRFKSTYAVHDTNKWWNQTRALMNYRIQIV